MKSFETLLPVYSPARERADGSVGLAPSQELVDSQAVRRKQQCARQPAHKEQKPKPTAGNQHYNNGEQEAQDGRATLRQYHGEQRNREDWYEHLPRSRTMQHPHKG